MKNRRSLFIKLTAVLLFVVCFVFVVASPLDHATKIKASDLTDSKVKEYEDRINQLQKDQKNFQQMIKDAQANAAGYLQKKEGIDKQIASLNDEIDISNALLIEYNNAIVAKEEAITAKQGEVDTKFEHFKERLRTSYEEGSMGYLAMLFSSDSISDFLTSIERMTNMLDYDRRTMKQINDEKSVLSEEKSNLEELKNNQQSVHNSLKDKETELEKMAQEAADYYNEQKNTEAEYMAKYNAAKKQEQKEAAALDKYLEELAKKNSGVYSGGPFSYPLPQNHNILTSKHGKRTYKIWGQWVTDYHRGIDISCPTGTPVYAGADGVVDIAGWGGSYGYYVVISHGSGYTTLYAHNSQLLVKQGQRVKRGQQIAKSGSTGNSSGPHLHIEISINGVLQDPIGSGLLNHPKFDDRAG